MTLLRKRIEPQEQEDEEEAPKPQTSPMQEKRKNIGDIEPIFDIIGWRVYQSEKQEDILEFPRDQYSQAKIFSKLLLLEKLATQ